jgi:hypothetical protein
MPTLSIRNVEARYRVTRAAASERRRLDAALAEVLAHELERAVDRLGIPDDELVCIQSLHVPVRLRLTMTDAALARTWSTVLAERIGRAAAGSPSHGVVRYPSRGSALLDFAVGVASGNLSRAWAWSQLGLCRPLKRAGEATALAELMLALLAEPAVIVPALVHLADLQLLAGLVSRIDLADWRPLAEVALRQAGVDISLESVQSLRSSSPTLLRRARRLVFESRIASAIVERRGEAEPRASALAALMILESDPGIVGAGGAETGKLLAAVADEIREARDEPREAPARANGRRDSVAKAADGKPKVVEVRRPLEVEASPALACPRLTPPPAFEPNPLAPLRPSARTRFGGLLFLVGVVDDLDLPPEIAARAARSERSMRWYLHQLALRLVSADVADAAVLAFAGLPPDAKPPSADADPPAAHEEAFLRELAGRVAERVRELMHRPAQPAPELLDFVCLRQAEIMADPGWIEARFTLEEVSTEVRRAVLDLDPGYVPWLGVVLKFRYE